MYFEVFGNEVKHRLECLLYLLKLKLKLHVRSGEKKS